MPVNDKHPTAEVSGLCVGGPLDGQIRRHNGETFEEAGMKYHWDVIYSGPEQAFNFWLPEGKGTNWLVGRLVTSYESVRLARSAEVPLSKKGKKNVGH